jgi:hypothetical protein
MSTRFKWEREKRDGDGVVQLTSGGLLMLSDVTSKDIYISDIATSLSRQVRFNGHGSMPLTVAQHSIMVAVLAHDLMRCDAKLSPAQVLDGVLEALLHDAAEAYLGDVPSPLRVYCPGLDDLELGIQVSIRQRLGLPSSRDSVTAAIRAADREALLIERNLLFSNREREWPNAPESPATRWRYCHVLEHSKARIAFMHAIHVLCASRLSPATEQQTAADAASIAGVASLHLLPEAPKASAPTGD